MIKEITNITTGIIGDYKLIDNPKLRVIVYNAEKEIKFDSEDNFTGKVYTPVTNTIKYGTVEEIAQYIEDEKLEVIDK